MKRSLYLLAMFALLVGNVSAKHLRTVPINSEYSEKASLSASKDKISTLSQDELYVMDEEGEEQQITPEELATEIEEEKEWYQTDAFRYTAIAAGVTAAALTGVYLCDPTLLPAAGVALWQYKDEAIDFTKKAAKGMGKWFTKGWRASKKIIGGAVAGIATVNPNVAKAANDNVIPIQIKKSDLSKIGVRSKIRSLQRASREGKLVFTNNPTRNPALIDKARAAYAQKYPNLDMSKVDMDHRVDLQLGGKDTLRNIAPLDSSVNRSIGAQISQAKKVSSGGGTPRIDFNYTE